MRNIFFVVIMLSAASGCGGVAVADKVATGSISKWIGSYDSVSGRCGALLVEESRITWGSCRQASTKPVSVSASELAMEVDAAAAECGWAGFIVALEYENGGKPRKNAIPEITVSAYQTPEDYRAANRFVQCSYLKKEQ